LLAKKDSLELPSFFQRGDAAETNVGAAGVIKVAQITRNFLRVPAEIPQF